ncbi:MAG: DNA gyrase inhibitor YacG [Planctomycetota bacterium]
MTGVPRPTPSAPCPTCGGPASLGRDNGARPFCSSRCKWVDLGRWLDGTYRVPAEEDDDDLPPPPSHDPSADRY